MVAKLIVGVFGCGCLSFDLNLIIGMYLSRSSKIFFGVFFFLISHRTCQIWNMSYVYLNKNTNPIVNYLKSFIRLFAIDYKKK